MLTRFVRAFLPHAALCLAAFVAILPILLHGPSCGHDFDFHLISWLEASTQFAHGGYPHWAFTPAFNAGEPRFLFYPPLSWSLGGLLGLILPWTLVPAAFTWIALTISGLTMRRFASRFCSPRNALLAGALYLANPYMLFTAYERTAYGELLAAAFVPLLFAAILAGRVRIVRIAVPLALIWLCNVPAGVMSSYALALMAAIRLMTGPGALAMPQAAAGQAPPRRTSVALATVCGAALGLCLAAFYLVPAVAEQHFIQPGLALIEGMRIPDNTLFHRMTPATPDNLAHNIVLHLVSLIAGLMLSFTFLPPVLSLLRDRGPFAERLRRATSGSSVRYAVPPFLFLALAVVFLLTPLSLPVWSHLPELRFLQFPWRLLALLGPIMALSLATLVHAPRSSGDTRMGRGAAASLLVVSFATVLAWSRFRQPCDAEDAVPGLVAHFHSAEGTDPTDEYTPIGANGDEPVHYPPFWIIPATPRADRNTPPPSGSQPGGTADRFSLDVPSPSYLVLNRRLYPAWQIRLNGTRVASVSPERDDGLMTILAPPGHDTIDLDFARTPDRAAGLALSCAALLVAATLARLRRRRQPAGEATSAPD